ncbi:HupE/UreJ family protein [Paenibacillus alginolyticus]|uniref:HupE/UreJ family protein n=1 Tax=Paenibacillus alginolyticus TaxID=59839 RepID=A0ABT4GGA0_9BACL|nr:HupE/UreJ family protein [Paenibacillus alginolyticus]MCY9695217.1 HupE/UreJ family protein [Paenibacillus alginolyticus]MEC0145174.1 HupE/UreJ family protein [Paenibacillus alginolyticus]
MYRLSVSASRMALCILTAVMLMVIPFKQAVYAHAYSASYTTLDLTKSQTGLTFAIDELSVIELAGGDSNDNKMLEPEEFERIKEKFAGIVKQNLTIKIGGEVQSEMQLQSIALDRQGDATKVILKAAYPPVTAGKPVSLKDTFYQNDSKANYVDLLTIHYGTESSTSALSAQNRSWTMMLTDNEISGLSQDLQSMKAQPSPNHEKSAVGSHAADAVKKNDAPSDWFSFFKLGMNHILGGYDHLLFLFSLLIARQTFKQYATMITAFTIAHSLTLTLTVFNIIHVSPAIVEPLIALSICYVALENIARQTVSLRWVLTFLFGLIHGMGFADILKEMEIPKAELATDLISFNLGIETVQLTIVGVLIPLLYMLHRFKYARRIVISGSSLALLLGAIWLIERVFQA